jgi:hypothetical protein
LSTCIFLEVENILGNSSFLWSASILCGHLPHNWSPTKA